MLRAGNQQPREGEQTQGFPATLISQGDPLGGRAAVRLGDSKSRSYPLVAKYPKFAQAGVGGV